ncbi:HNH endonuclease [Nostoc sp. UHCC 0302]|uniref:HNH endonuclease n=1 Tax=Nostoc sp. UHCC 0302 TaxID=3134896 RepID=UPI00311C9DD3
MSRSCYPSNWKQIATAVKNASSWQCSRCGRVCLRPDEKPLELTLSQRRVYNLQVHDWNMNPEDNRLENLASLCSSCLYYHRGRKGNVSSGH